jgi:3D-(3,5/4)-trihydroxycyclohexane-1,2-dione acylhydrolase (decyclizing)
VPEVSTRASVREARERYEAHVAERGGRSQASDDDAAGSDEPDNA